jgi:hypothetical protein
MARTWRALRWRHLVLALAVGALISASIGISNLWLNLFWKPWSILHGIRMQAIFAAVFIVAVVALEANVRRRRPTLGQYGLAGLVAAVICIAIAYTFASLLVTQPPRREVPGYPKPTHYATRVSTPSAVFADGFDGVAHCFIGLLVYVRLRNARLAQRSLLRAQLRSSEAARADLSARLESVRERVDPAWLTRSLEDIERTYAIDPRIAEVHLDALIDFLRAAIPEVRAGEQGATPRSVIPVT